MSFLSALIRGEYEITCSPDPGVDLLIDKEREMNNATEKMRLDDSSNRYKDSMISKKESSSLNSQVQKVSVSSRSSSKNILDFIEGEADILCFSPTLEDCSPDAACGSEEDLTLKKNENDDESDGLIFVDINNNKRITPSRKNPSPNIHLRQNVTKTVKGQKNVDLHTLSLANKNGDDTDPRKNKHSPSTVITGFTCPMALSHTDKAGRDFMNALYDRDNKTFMIKDLKAGVDDSSLETKKKVHRLNFESAGFLQAESLSMQRRIKLQSHVRELNAGLSNDSEV